MTNAATISIKPMTRDIARMIRVVEHAPTVVTLLSGWINVGEGQCERQCVNYPGGADAFR